MKTRVTNITNLFLSITFCLGLASCNKEEFYEKEFLENPYQDKPTTDGSVAGGTQGGTDSGVAGGTQGGVDSGVEGGTVGGTTGSSTTGGTTTGDSSTTGGSTTGGSTTGGSTTGGSTTGGSTTGGSTTGGSTTGGSTTGGSTTGGSTTGGSTTGGTTTGGTTTGGVVYVEQTDSFKQTATETKKLDILWVIDNSGSMSDEQSALGTNFSAFIDDFITKDVDFKMAITTTDTSSSSKRGAIVGSSDTKLTSLAAKTNESKFKSDFRNLVKVGTSGSGYEKGLDASEGFMSKHAQTFIRPDAYLAVVILSDEEDQSSKTVDYYTDVLKSYKQSAGLVKIYSIVNMRSLSYYKRYAEASNKTAGIVSDIRDDFHRSLSDMGGSIINLLDSFPLSNEPQGSLNVYVNGVREYSYTYDSASRSIKFDQGYLPPVGAEIKVTYLK